EDLQGVKIAALQDQIDQLKLDLRRLNDDLRRQPAVTPSISASINPAQPVAPLPAAGRIVLENHYTWPATIVVNNQSYRLQPFERAVLTAPAGPFTYAAYTDNVGLVQGEVTRVLAPGRDFPIVINPQ